jgi:hypothetical protein
MKVPFLVGGDIQFAAMVAKEFQYPTKEFTQ